MLQIVTPLRAMAEWFEASKDLLLCRILWIREEQIHLISCLEQISLLGFLTKQMVSISLLNLCHKFCFKHPTIYSALSSHDSQFKFRIQSIPFFQSYRLCYFCEILVIVLCPTATIHDSSTLLNRIVTRLWKKLSLKAEYLNWAFL